MARGYQKRQKHGIGRTERKRSAAFGTRRYVVRGTNMAATSTNGGERGPDRKRQLQAIAAGQ